MFDVKKELKISRDQSLGLRAKLIEYMREALANKKGWVIFEVKDLDTFEFDFYYSSNGEIVVRYEEPKEATLDRILYTINCQELTSISNIDDTIDDMLQHLYNYIIGFISANILHDKYGLGDHSLTFKRGWHDGHEPEDE